MRHVYAQLMSILLIILVATVLVTGCTEGGEPQKTADKEVSGSKVRPDSLVIASGNNAGTYYYIATGQAKILSDKIDGLTVNNEATNGSINFNLASQDVDTIGMGGLEQVISAIQGREDRGYSEALDNIGVIQSGHKYVLYCVTAADSGIETFADLNGKKIGRPALVGSASPMISMLYEAYGVDVSTLKEIPSSHSENIDALKDGAIDAAFIAGGVPMAGLTDLVTSKDIKILDIDADLIKPYLEKEPYYELLTIEPNTYNKQTQPVNLMTVDVVLAANLNLDDDLVYEITKALNENVEEMTMIHTDGSQWNLENSLNLYKKDIVAFHPGAARYYEEFK